MMGRGNAAGGTSVAGLVREFAHSLTHYGDLLRSFVSADLRARHRDKLLGMLWTVVDPLMMMLVYLFIVRVVFDSRAPDYPVYLYSALIAWRYFAQCTQGASASLVSRGGLLSQAYFPRVLVPLSQVLGAAYEFLFAGLVLIALFIYLDIGVSWPLLMLPVVFLLQSLLNVGFALICSAIGITLRDLPNVLTFVMRFGWYLSPGLYHVEQIPEHLRTWYMLNPMAVIFTLYRDVTMYARWPDPLHLAYVAGLAVGVFLLGLWVFHRREGVFTKYL